MRWFILITTAFISLPGWALDSLTATIDRNPVLENESFVLTVTAEGDVDRNAIDFSHLLDQFVVGGTQVSSQTQIINFKSSQSTTWTTSLIATQAGEYQIPAFILDGKTTQPIKVRVVKAGSAAAGNQQQRVFLQSEINQDAIYPGQQAVLTTRLYIGVNLDSGSLSEPQAEGVKFQQIGKDQDQMEIVHGQRYRMIQRRYAFSAQQPGELLIQPADFSGSAISNQRRSFFANQSQPISAHSKPVTVEVKPLPDNAPQPWFVAELVSLQSQFEHPDTAWVIGEPVTRTITLTAAGALPDNLPTIHTEYPASFNHYLDKPQLESGFRGQTSVAKQQLSVALIPTQAGEFTLPAIELPWWNATNHRLETATIPATTITVQPAAKSDATAATFTPELAQPKAPQIVEQPGIYRPLSYLFALLWCMTSVLWLLHVRRLKRQPQPSETAMEPSSSSEASCWKTLTKALSSNQPKEVDMALRQWKVALQTAGFNLALLDNSELDQLLNAMYASRFSTAPKAWRAEPLSQLLQQIRKQLLASPSKSTLLKPLYPDLTQES